MYAQVPAFQAWRCHGNGRRTRRALKKEKSGKSGYVGSDICAGERWDVAGGETQKSSRSGLSSYSFISCAERTPWCHVLPQNPKDGRWLIVVV